MGKENSFKLFDCAGSFICDLLGEYFFLLRCLPFSSSISFSGAEVCYHLSVCKYLVGPQCSNLKM